jgi:hypothetical protein
MSSLTTVGLLGLHVVTPNPSGAGGLAINDNFKSLANATNYLGAWNNSSGYALNDIVQYDGLFYISILTPNEAKEPDTSPTYWSPFGNTGDYLPLSGGTITGTLTVDETISTQAISTNDVAFTNDSSISTDGGGGISILDHVSWGLTVDSGNGGIVTSGGNTLDDGYGNMQIFGQTDSSPSSGGVMIGQCTGCPSVVLSVNTLGPGYAAPLILLHADGSNICGWYYGEDTPYLRLNVGASNSDTLKLYTDGSNAVKTLNNVLDDGNGNATVALTMTATAFSGSGADLTSLPAANLTGSLPAISGASLTSLTSANLSGTVSGTNGGTGVNNGSKTITLGGNLTTSGAYNTTLTATAATSVTLPTGGTLLSTTSSLNASNIASGTIGNSYLPSNIGNSGSTVFSGAYVNTVTTQTLTGATYNVSASDSVILVNASNGFMTIKLPSPINGREYTIKRIDSSAHVVLIATTSSNIDGASTYGGLSSQYDYVTVVSDGTNWWIVAYGTT